MGQAYYCEWPTILAYVRQRKKHFDCAPSREWPGIRFFFVPMPASVGQG